jgi:hypothetical protein
MANGSTIVSRELSPVYDVFEDDTTPAPVATVVPSVNNSTAAVAPPATNKRETAPAIQNALGNSPLPSSLTAPSLGNIDPGQLSLPAMPSTDVLAKKTQETQKQMGAANTANPLSQVDIRKYLHDLIDNDMVLGALGGAAAGVAGYKMLNKKAKSIEERDIVKSMERKEPSFDGYGNEFITPAAERHMADPMVRDGVTESALKAFIKSDKLPKDPLELDLITNQYLKTNKMAQVPPVDLSSGMNFAPGEPTFSIPTTQDIGAKINQPGPATQGNVEVPADASPVHVQEEQNLQSVAQTPEEKSKTLEVAKQDVEKAFVPEKNPILSNEPQIPNAVKPLTTGSGMPAFQGTAPEGTKFKKNLQGEKKIQTFEGLHEIPSTHAFVPNGQYMDILRNAIGQEAFTSGLQKAGGYPETPQKAYELSRAINESQSRLPRDIAKDLNIGLGETTKAITQKMPGGAKSASMKGPLAGVGAVILMSDLANAETPAERKAILRDAAEGMLPLGVNPTEAGAPGLTPAILESQRQATLLGSPYRKTEKKSKR